MRVVMLLLQSPSDDQVCLFVTRVDATASYAPTID